MKYTLSVPLEQYDMYLQHEWIYKGMDAERSGFALVEKEVQSSPDDDKDVSMGPAVPIKRLQSGTIRRPLGKYQGTRLFDCVTLTQLGKAEAAMRQFASLKRMCHTAFAYELFKADNLYIKKDNRSYAIRIYTRLRGLELSQYVDGLNAIREGRGKLSLPSGFSSREIPAGELPSAPDFWWDTENDTMFSFDKNFMARLSSHLDVSFAMFSDVVPPGGNIRRAD